MPQRTFTVVMRGPAATVFWQNETLRVESHHSAVGPVNITYATRWVRRSDQVTIPAHLWIEIVGTGTSLEDVLVPFANAGMAYLFVLSVAANASVGEPDVEIGYDSTPGVTEREYFQNYVPPESGIVHAGRRINVPATLAVLRAMTAHPDSERLLRAANQYRLALETWRLGRESLSLAHLWMALEALTIVQFRAECVRVGAQTAEDLAMSLGVELKHLDATVRRKLILQNDDECYQKAKQASDGFEHGFLGYDKIRAHAKDVRHRMATYIRTAILELSDTEQPTPELLLRDPFDKPMGHWPLVKYVRGRLIGDASQLAAPGNAYPILRWNPTVKACEAGDAGQMKITLEENLTPEVGAGITVQVRSLEVWQPG